MNTDLSFQEQCWRDGISCRSCISHSARSVANVCSGLTADQAAHTFRRMYSEPACLMNENDFTWAYLEADGQVAPLLSKKIIPLIQINAA